MRILPDVVTISSYPGPDRSIDLEDLRNGRGVTRRYRNRRIGEFLKELNLTEGRGTGIPKILRAIRKNGSPPPSFETDADRTYFVARFPIHLMALQRLAKEGMAEAEKTGIKSRPAGQLTLGIKLEIKLGINAEMILEAMIQDSHVTAKALSERLGISTPAIDNHIAKLKEHGIITRKGARKSGTWEVRLEKLNADIPLNGKGDG